MRLLTALVLFCAPAMAEEARVSSGFGARIDPIHHRRAVHKGVDLPGRQGTPVVAAASGTVRWAGRQGSYGELVELAHPDGSATRYAHLSRILVRAGERVEQGQLIARMGSTGRSTGSHLHFEYRVGGVAIDPWPHVGRIDTFRERPPQVMEAPHRSRFSMMRAGDVPLTDTALPDAGEVVRGHAP
jgi:murein DD-endopeptidase MepM/ murein hydrolase activator NlpD